jgi:hypothetical protein
VNCAKTSPFPIRQNVSRKRKREERREKREERREREVSKLCVRVSA